MQPFSRILVKKVKFETGLQLDKDKGSRNVFLMVGTIKEDLKADGNLDVDKDKLIILRRIGLNSEEFLKKRSRNKE